jgi:hypothetical protein
MPVIRDALDALGHACVQLILLPSAPRRRAMSAAGQLTPHPSSFTGMLDTGAAVTIIDPHIHQALNLVPYRARSIFVPSHSVPVRVLCYKVDLVILDRTGALAGSLVVPMLTVFETPLSHTGTDVLIGCDVLSRCAFLHHGLANTFTLSY